MVQRAFTCFPAHAQNALHIADMKLIIAGGRDYQLGVHDFIALGVICGNHGVTEVVSGGATGADQCGEEWAHANKIPVTRHPAQWKKLGNRAGPIRNKEMAEYADAVALFPGGKGTKNMYQEAKKAGLKIFDFRNSV